MHDSGTIQSFHILFGWRTTQRRYCGAEEVICRPEQWSTDAKCFRQRRAQVWLSVAYGLEVSPRARGRFGLEHEKLSDLQGFSAGRERLPITAPLLPLLNDRYWPVADHRFTRFQAI